jgi:hypothetical protein
MRLRPQFNTKGMRVMKKILIGLGVLVILLIAAVVIVPALVPVETY